MFGRSKNEGMVLDAPDMRGVAPGSPEERAKYESWKAAKIAVNTATQERKKQALVTVGGDMAVVNRDVSQALNSGRVPVVSTEVASATQAEKDEFDQIFEAAVPLGAEGSKEALVHRIKVTSEDSSSVVGVNNHN